MAGFAEEFAEFTKRNESLAPFTFLKVGGPAEYLVQPRSREQLAAGKALGTASALATVVVPATLLGVSAPEEMR